MLQSAQQTSAIVAASPAFLTDHTPTPRRDETFSGLLIGSAGSAWHNIPDDQMEQVSLQRDSWTGLIVPQQVCMSSSAILAASRSMEQSACYLAGQNAKCYSAAD